MLLNREGAGNKLATKLIEYQNHEDVILAAIPRGGVPVGYSIAKKLHVPLELVLSKKIGHPDNKEFAIGAITLKSRILSIENDDEVSKEYIENETEHIRDILKQRHKWFYGNRIPLRLNDKIVIIVDDGAATGNTLLSSIKLIQEEKPKSIIVALPVAPMSVTNTIKELPFVTQVVSLMEPENFNAVGEFYKEFNQVDDDTVLKLLNKASDNYLSYY